MIVMVYWQSANARGHATNTEYQFCACNEWWSLAIVGCGRGEPESSLTHVLRLPSAEPQWDGMICIIYLSLYRVCIY